MNNQILHYGVGLGVPDWLQVAGLPFLLLVVWSVTWKGLALWHSAGRKQGWWFFFLLIVNTVGILEIIYLVGILKLKFSQLFPKG
jgi:hypothetical protein